jgi:predicted MFS family arabinose efflux permease
MVAYIGVAPIVGAFADLLPRRAFLVTMDAVRAAVAACLPFVDQIWQVYVLIFLLQSASAAFTPTFQATIPDVLPDEERYTKALSLSRLAYDLESLLSPTLAALLLAVLSFENLFLGTALGFAASALLVVSVVLPQPTRAERRAGIYDRMMHGIRIYLRTPRLRGLLALNLAAAAGGATVIIKTVVIVRDLLGRAEADVALALGAFGGGSMAAALLLPRLLGERSDRSVMTTAAGALAVLLFALSAALVTAPAALWPGLLVVWFALGACYSLVLTPTGRLLRRSAQPVDRPALFAAQFALSHLCWLVAYPVAGWLGATLGLGVAVAVTGAMAAVAVAAAAAVWSAEDPDVIEHEHTDLTDDHPHLRGEAAAAADGRRHAHAFAIDDLHRHWPSRPGV